jgi:ankyrin repeat protein
LLSPIVAKLTFLMHQWEEDIRDLVHRGDIPKIQEALRYNPDIVHEADDLGWTVLHEAVRAGRHEVVELLLKHGADKDHLTEFPCSPLNVARRYLKDENHKVVQLLKNLGAKDVGPTPRTEL